MSGTPTRTLAAPVALLMFVSGLLLLSPAGPAVAKAPTCSVQHAKVTPHKARFSALGTKTYKVVPVKRTRDGSIGTPPVTTAGKKLVGWDPHRRPGTGSGSVILDAHTWPDGSALGNAMLKKLKKGAVITMTDGHGKGVCYRIDQRTSYPRAKVPRARMFRTWGHEQLVIVVCSGKRLGPGNWLRRTVWFGTPIAQN